MTTPALAFPWAVLLRARQSDTTTAKKDSEKMAAYLRSGLGLTQTSKVQGLLRVNGVLTLGELAALCDEEVRWASVGLLRRTAVPQRHAQAAHACHQQARGRGLYVVLMSLVGKLNFVPCGCPLSTPGRADVVPRAQKNPSRATAAAAAAGHQREELHGELKAGKVVLGDRSKLRRATADSIASWVTMDMLQTELTAETDSRD